MKLNVKVQVGEFVHRRPHLPFPEVPTRHAASAGRPTWACSGVRSHSPESTQRPAPRDPGLSPPSATNPRHPLRTPKRG